MARMGIKKDDLKMPIQQLAESTRALARVESAQILSKKFITRDRVKQRIVQNQERYLDRVSQRKQGLPSFRRSEKAPIMLMSMYD